MAKTLISTPLNITTSDTAVSTVDITSGIDDTYSVYEFHFYNIHASDDDAELQFQVNASDGADWNDSPLTTTFFSAYHNEDDSGTPALSYHTGHDIANAATFQNIHYNLWNNVNESGMSGSMTLYDPSSTTYVKHFISRVSSDGFAMASDVHMAGYINDTTDITEIRFKISAGTIDAGIIKMFGVS
jgi:hypothetical protein|tara:strand:+ start:385 stop:942 length:558 start_codon:yes stop_codon:yes gene_type:complete